jgi:hypothetical protein
MVWSPVKCRGTPNDSDVTSVARPLRRSAGRRYIWRVLYHRTGAPEAQLPPPSEAHAREDRTTGVFRVTRGFRDVESFGSLKGLKG